MSVYQPVALVTGAGRRLGYDVCRYWLEQGWKVFAHHRSPSAEVDDLRARGALTLQADFEVESDVLSVVEAVRAQTTTLDLVVHNASAFSRDGDDLLANIRAYETFFRVHMLAPFILNESLAPLLMATPRPYADIIHMTDIFADRPNPVFASYCSTKAGLSNLSMSYAKKLAPKVKVNAIQPGPIKFLPTHAESVRASILKETLLGVEGGFEPVVAMIAAIVANTYMTGGSIRIDGGRALA